MTEAVDIKMTEAVDIKKIKEFSNGKESLIEHYIKLFISECGCGYEGQVSICGSCWARQIFRKK